MLLRFRCKNFRSIREEQELSLVAAKTRTDEKSESLIETSLDDLKLLRCAAIYGPNASGKSNILAALSTFCQMVSYSHRLWRPNGPIPAYAPFLLDENSRNDESEFELSFLLESSIYKYGFRFNQTTFLKEWLIDTTNRDKVLFVRTTGGETANLSFPNRNLGKSSEDSRHLEGIRRDVRPNSLFLSASAQRNHPVLSQIFAYLSANSEVVQGQNFPMLIARTAATCADSSRRDQIAKMLEFADTGIHGLSVISKDVPDGVKQPILSILKAMKDSSPEAFSQLQTDGTIFFPAFEIRMSHLGSKGKLYPLDTSQESYGTLAYFSILGPLLDKLRDGGVLMIDELESNLHPILAGRIMAVLNSSDLNPKGAQIIFTTHNSNLLDLDLLRRDQIWFTEKSQEGTTKLFSLFDFHPQPRTDQNIETRYLGGRFGAIPFLDNKLLLESLLSKVPTQGSLKFSGEN